MPSLKAVASRGSSISPLQVTNRRDSVERTRLCLKALEGRSVPRLCSLYDRAYPSSSRSYKVTTEDMSREEINAFKT